jgi:hypothetical protein
MLNLNSLFTGSRTGFHQQLLLEQKERTMLSEARKIIRNALREGLPALIKKAHPKLTKIPIPKFNTQGSWAYETIIWPAWIPPQQADMDDGCYLPLSFLKGAVPDIASKFFFEAVEEVLAPVAKLYGWKINPGGPKSTCTRIEIDSTKHIDIPLYAIPDGEFEKLIEFFEKAQREGRADMLRTNSEWDLLPTDSLLLAHRDEGWKKSDPRPIKDWVTRQILLKTEQLRRLMRYIKAWRDWQWTNGHSPASILLMVAVDQALQKPEAGDDLALLKVAAKLPEILAGKVENPTAPGEILSDKLDKDGIRQEVIARAQQLHTSLHHAIMVCDRPEEACLVLQQLFGPRFPTDVTSVDKVKAAAIVAATPARKIEKEPIVGRSTAG